MSKFRPRIFGVFGRELVRPDLSPPRINTQATDISQATEGVPYIFPFNYSGNPPPEPRITGYTGQFQLTDRGVFIINSPIEGTYTCQFQLLDDEGNIAAFLDFTLSVVKVSDLITATIESDDLDDVIFGDPNPRVPLIVGGSGPYRNLRVTAGALPDGIAPISGQTLTAAELAITCLTGLAVQEGAGVSVTLGITGANGVEVTKVFSNGVTVNREPSWVNLEKLAILPNNTPGTLDLTKFVRAYPAVTSMTASPALSTIHANLGITGLTITYGDLTTIANTQKGPITLTLGDSGIGEPGELTSLLEVKTTGTVPPLPGIISEFDFSTLALSEDDDVVVVNDIAQGSVIQMTVAPGYSAPTFNATTKAAKFRGNQGMRIPNLIDLPPYAIGWKGTIFDTSSTGVVNFMTSQSENLNIDQGVAGGNAPVFVDSQTSTKSGTASSYSFDFTPSSAINVFALCAGHGSTGTDRIASVTITGDDDVPVAVPRVPTNGRAVETTGENVSAYAYFLGSGVPAGTLTVNITFDSSNATVIRFTAFGWLATTDCEIVDSDKVQSVTANPSVTLTTGGRECTAFGILMSGHDDAGSITSGAGLTPVGTKNDFGVAIYCVDRLTTETTSNVTFGYTAASENVAMVAVLVSEVQGTGTTLSSSKDAKGNTGVQASYLNNAKRNIIYLSGVGAGSYWNNGVKEALSLSGSGDFAGRLNDIIFRGTSGCDLDLEHVIIWKGTLSDGDAATLDTRLNTDLTPPTPPPPNPPAGVQASGGDTIVNLSWIASPGATSYKVRRSTTSGSGFSEIASGVTGLSYQDTGRTNGTPYYYTIRATGSGGDSVDSAEASATPQSTVTGAPRNLSAVEGSTVITLSWEAPTSGGTGYYNIYRGTASGGPYVKDNTNPVNALTYQDTGLTNGTPYYFVVRAVNPTTSAESANSNQVQATPRATTGGITKSWPGFATTTAKHVNAFMTIAQHNSRLQWTMGQKSGTGAGGTIHQRKFNQPDVADGHKTPGGFYVCKRINKALPAAVGGQTIPMLEFTIWNTQPVWSGNNSIRCHLDSSSSSGDSQVYETWTVGARRWIACRFMIDPSMTQIYSVGWPEGSIADVHEHPDDLAPIGTGQTGWTMQFQTDNTTSGRVQFAIQFRGHASQNPAVNQNDPATLQTIRFGPYFEPNQVIDYIIEFAEHPLETGTLDGVAGSPTTHYWKIWIWINNQPQNGGNPYVNRTSRFGYHVENRRLSWRPVTPTGLYVSGGVPMFDPLSVNNLTGIPAGSKGLRQWVIKGCHVPHQTAGGITTSLSTLLDWLRLIE